MEPTLETTKSPKSGAMLRQVQRFHQKLIFPRRARVLSSLLAELIPDGATVLDVGCGNGMIGYLVKQTRPTISIQGLEVMPRPSCSIRCAPFDGVTIPMRDSSVDVCMFVDVLHHARNIDGLLQQAQRVARRHVLIKDHVCENKFDRALLTFMDWVGNRAVGVPLPYEYQSKAEWFQLFSRCRLQVIEWNQRLPLYPPPFGKLFGRGLHCIALLKDIPVNLPPR